MPKSGPIIVIDDDPDDQEMIHRILAKMNLENEVKRFLDGEDAFRYFLQTSDKPLLVICDINMPRMNGIELKQNIEDHSTLSTKRMPFVFLSTTSNPDQVMKAYKMSCQGFFIKGQTYSELKETVSLIVSYWKVCEYPSR